MHDWFPRPSERHVATHKQSRRLAIFTHRRVNLARPRNDASMLARQSPRSPYRSILGRLLCRSEDGLEVAGLIAVEGGDNDQLGCFLLGSKSSDMEAVFRLD